LANSHGNKLLYSESRFKDIRLTDSETSGIVLPVPLDYVNRILNRKRSVFVKYTSRVPKKLTDFRLHKGMKVLFYVSNSGRKIAGEAEIAGIEFMPPAEVLEKYRDQLVLSQSELSSYQAARPGRGPEKPLLVLSLGRVRRYPEGTTYHRNVSMAGEFLRLNVYNDLSSRVSAHART
jgi:hypothetical protein